jgi:hypothetical protein
MTGDDRQILEHIDNALHELRAVFNGLVPEAQRIGLKRVARRSE